MYIIVVNNTFKKTNSSIVKYSQMNENVAFDFTSGQLLNSK